MIFKSKLELLYKTGAKFYWLMFWWLGLEPAQGRNAKEIAHEKLLTWIANAYPCSGSQSRSVCHISCMLAEQLSQPQGPQNQSKSQETEVRSALIFQQLLVKCFSCVLPGLLSFKKPCALNCGVLGRADKCWLRSQSPVKRDILHRWTLWRAPLQWLLSVPGDELEGPQKATHHVLSLAGQAWGCRQAGSDPKRTPSLAEGFTGYGAGVVSP